MRKKIKNILLSLTIYEREKKQFKQYKKIRDEFFSLSAEEQEFRFVLTKTKYDSKKNIAFSLILGFLVSIGFGVWNTASKIFITAMKLNMQNEISGKEYKIYMLYAAILIIIIMITLIFIVISVINNLYKLNRELIIYTEVRNRLKRGIEYESRWNDNGKSSGGIEEE
ncbi:cell division protein FtsL [Breznakia sp. PF5-3]|uniref:hypothetical protein n=1 Tax=unclassified Breznakia TaxID=2623764 RepID=UPI0024059CE3|nr:MULTISPECIES: hypothetical protein [unclassified Breznakia]MDF9825177.1 cell division protein FtsL [Breznakia sp. PM6-1]MDF9836035.1 cell division protein FtsL [Breznakia sp. PF5-3]MDF9838604.1 cell division protein FtsL [Breznakia sp. PFB2-8]MDF9860627.1 cell division protein FtsL [Breznakia sp. PH5-24]